MVIAGEQLPESIHALAHAMNVTLDNVGSTVQFTKSIEPDVGKKPIDLKTLVDEMLAGQVDVLIVFDTNPAYSAPADIPFLEAIQRVAFRVHLGPYVDETGAKCDWHIPQAHYLETWGDAIGYDGTASIQQPLIEPLYGGRSAIEFFAAIRGPEEPSGRDIVRSRWRSKAGGPEDFDEQWEAWLRKGSIANTAAHAVKAEADNQPERPASATSRDDATIEIQFLPDPTLHDGRFANNGWLQELPKPVTKLTWGNAAIMSPATARRLGVRSEPIDRGGQHGGVEADVLVLKFRDRAIRAAAFALVGHAEDTVTIYLGNGRALAGHVGSGVGSNAFQIRYSDTPWFAAGLEVIKTGDEESQACTQHHHNMENRDPVVHTEAGKFSTFSIRSPVDDAAKKAAATALPSAGTTPPPPAERDSRVLPLTLYPEWSYKDRKWAMTIDLSTCTGCSACVVACQSENNIPVVGRDQVLRGREMHWIRIDRYHAGPDANHPENMFFQPVTCMQCEKAPCELVCPVGRNGPQPRWPQRDDLQPLCRHAVLLE